MQSGYLMALLEVMDITVVYGAVHLPALKTEIYGSADPVDVCFRKCLSEIRDWADASTKKHVSAQLGDNFTVERMTEIMVPSLLSQLVILIVDECDGKTKNTLQKSFRSLRPAPASPLECLHDDMYFGDSRYSIGIQLADLCSYFIARHLEGDTEIEAFYQIIKPRIYQPKSNKSEEAPEEPINAKS